MLAISIFEFCPALSGVIFDWRCGKPGFTWLSAFVSAAAWLWRDK